MITYYSSNRIIDRNFGSVAYVPPATFYFGLSTTTINIDGTGATEPVAGAYARIPLVNDKTNWTTAASGILTNSNAVTFVESTASWGTITYVGIWDALTVGNLWWYDVLTPARAVASNTTVLFAAGSITVTMNNT